MRKLAAAERSELQFVEEVGLVFAETGLPKIAGRILGWLLICHPPEQSQAEIGQVIGASKGSVSTMTRLLLQMGLVERVGVPGSPRDLWRMRPDAFSRMVGQWAERARRMRELAESGLAVLHGAEAPRKDRLRDMQDLYAFLEREMPAVVERFARRRR